MASAWGASFGSAWGNSWGAIQEQPQVLASLGGVPHEVKRKPKPVLVEDEIEEPIQSETVNRLRHEFLSESLAQDLIARSRVRKARAEETALLLMI